MNTDMKSEQQLSDALKQAETRAADVAKNGSAPAPEHIMQFFAYENLPPHLADVSRPFAALAEIAIATLPRNPERIVALRKLLEAKDAALRALVAR